MAMTPTKREKSCRYKRLPVRKLSGSEKFKNAAGKNISILEFWRYGFSNLNSNVLRGVLAEFLVENAIRRANAIGVRNPWNDHDILLGEGAKIEVKCCAYIQDWDQHNLSRVTFSGLKAKKLYYSSAAGKMSRKPGSYKSDLYVFALLRHQNPRTLNILDLDQWCFYVLAKDILKTITRNGNSISIKTLEKSDIAPVRFNELKGKISEAVRSC